MLACASSDGSVSILFWTGNLNVMIQIRKNPQRFVFFQGMERGKRKKLVQLTRLVEIKIYFVNSRFVNDSLVQVGCNAVSWCPSLAPGSLVDPNKQPQVPKRLVTGGCDNLVKIWK